MRIVHYETDEIGRGALEIYTDGMTSVSRPFDASSGDTLVLVDEEHLEEIDNMNHILGVRYLYNEPL